jgi:hypothetical protein
MKLLFHKSSVSLSKGFSPPILLNPRASHVEQTWQQKATVHPSLPNPSPKETEHAPVSMSIPVVACTEVAEYLLAAEQDLVGRGYKANVAVVAAEQGEEGMERRPEVAVPPV